MLVDRRFSNSSSSEPCKAALGLAVAHRKPEDEAEALVDREAEAEAPVAQADEAVVSRLPFKTFSPLESDGRETVAFFIGPSRSARQSFNELSP